MLTPTLTAFGGFGFASRLWGLTLDTITAVNLVLPNGTITRVTDQNNPDLFWVRISLYDILDEANF